MKKLVLSAIALGAVVFAACSSDNTATTTPPADAGVDRKTPPPPAGDDSGSGDDAGQTHDQCVAACEMKYAAGLTLDKKIDDCWSANCQGPCVDGMGGFDASAPDAGDSGDAGDGGAPMCTNGVDTGDMTCDLCTEIHCCAAWDGCFSDKTCSDLNDCRSNCPP